MPFGAGKFFQSYRIEAPRGKRKERALIYASKQNTPAIRNPIKAKEN
jgi:hypothetical protein